MHKYTFTFLLVALFSFTSKSQNLDLIKSSLNQFKKEFHHKPNSSNNWSQANLRIAQNPGKKLDSLVQEKWNDDLQDWEYSATGYFYYDKNGNSSHFILAIVNPTNTITGTGRWDWSFDELSHTITITSVYKLPASEEWINDGKDEYVYDESGRLKEEINLYWSDETLQYDADRRREYSYNEKGQLVREIGYGRGIDDWYISENYGYLYDGNGELISKNYLHSLPDTDDLYIRTYIDYVKINSRQSEERWYYKNDLEDTWKQSSISKLNYDTNGNLVSDSTFSYFNNQLELVNPELVNLEMYEYDFSLDVSEVDLFADLLWSPLQLASMVNQPTVAIGTFYTDEGLMSYSKNSYYFSVETITNTENFASNKVTIYPNPAQSVLNINGLENNQSVNILNINGTLVSSMQVQDGKIPTQGLRPGLYILDLGDQKLKFGVTK